MPLLERLYLSNSAVIMPSVRLDQCTSMMWLKMSDAGLRTLADVQFPVTMTHLDASNNNITTLADVQFPVSMTHLDVSNNYVTIVGDNFCENMTLLEKLDISRNRLSVIMFSGCTNLMWLSISRNHLKSMGDVRFPPDVTYLDISHNMIASLENVRFPANMTYLDISYNGIDSLGENFCDRVQGLQRNECFTQYTECELTFKSSMNVQS